MSMRACVRARVYAYECMFVCVFLQLMHNNSHMMGNHDLLTQVSRHTSGHSGKSVEYAVHPASAVHGPHVCPAGRGDSHGRAGHAWHVGTQTPGLSGTTTWQSIGAGVVGQLRQCQGVRRLLVM